MGITNNANRVRIESSAKNGTLGTQGAINADQIKFDTAITTNNGNLMTSPVFRRRHVILRRGEVDEECGLIRSVEVDGLTCTMYRDWESAPASGDAYDVGYRLEDCATVAGCSQETDSQQFVMTKRLIVGIGATTFGMLGMGHGQVLRTDDRGATQSDILINEAGWFLIGTIKVTNAGEEIGERGATIIFDKSNGDEPAMEIEGNAHMFEFMMQSMRAPTGVRGLTVTHAVGSNVIWGRFQGHGMDTPYKKRVRRPRSNWAGTGANVLGTEEALTVGDLKAMDFYNGWCHSQLDASFKDALSGKADTAKVRIFIED